MHMQKPKTFIVFFGHNIFMFFSNKQQKNIDFKTKINHQLTT